MKTKNIKSIALIIAAATAFPASAIAQADTQTPAQRLEKGVFLQETKKDIDAAIREFQSILEDEDKAKNLGAEARFHLMQCYLSQDDQNSAEKQLKALQKNYPADNRWVKKAVRTLHKPVQLRAASWQSGELLRYNVNLPNGKTIGSFIIAIEEKGADGKQVWSSYIMRNAGGFSFSNAVFDQVSYQPIKSKSYTENMGSQHAIFSAEGGAIITNSQTGKEQWRTDEDAAKPHQPPIYDNDQVVQLLRTIPHQIGTEYKTNLVSVFASTLIPFNCKVTAHEEIQTSAGKFQCAKIETSINQDFWVSTDANRYLVKMGVGTVDILLNEVTTFDSSKSNIIKVENREASIELSGEWIHTINTKKKNICRILMSSTDFVVKRAMIELNLSKNLTPKAKESSQAFGKEVVKKVKEKMPDCTVDENSRSTGTIGTVPYVAFASTGTQGKLKIHTYHVYAVGKKDALALRLYHDGKNLESVQQKAANLIKGIKIK